MYFLMKGSIDFEESDECVRQEVWDKLFMRESCFHDFAKMVLKE